MSTGNFTASPNSPGLIAHFFSLRPDRRDTSLWLAFHAQAELVKQEGPHIRTLFDLFL